VPDGPPGGNDGGPSPDADVHDPNGRLSRLEVTRAGRTSVVDVDRIDRIEAADYYVRLHVEEATHLLRITMKELERRLDPARFVRIHRSHIVRVDVIRELRPHPGGGYLVILDDGTRLPLSRSRRRKLEGALDQRL